MFGDTLKYPETKRSGGRTIITKSIRVKALGPKANCILHSNKLRMSRLKVMLCR